MRFAILLLLVLLFYGCENETKQEFVVQFLELPGCAYLLDENELVIRNDSEFTVIESLCSSLNFPQINFNDSSLLAKTITIGCDDEIEGRIYKDDLNQKYIYNIEIQRGLCKVAAVVSNWALVPKLPNDFTVEFNVIYP